MRTNRQTSGPAGRSQIDWTDDSGTVWHVDVHWSVIGGRVECSRLDLDSGGKGAFTSTIARQVEQRVREERRKHERQVKRLAKVGGEVGRRASRQVPAFEHPRAVTRPGRPRADDVWLRRAQVMRKAWEQRKPMATALADAEPGFSPATYRKWIDRARAWDRETGAGVLDGVGRPRDGGKG